MDILKLFQYNEKLRFVDIEKALKVRSNKLSYHLKKLTRKGILIKEGIYYSLSETAEHLIPYISEKKGTIPVILIHLGNQDEVFLIKRKKRPYKNKLSLPGGRLILGESIEEGTKRIMKEKFNLEVEFKKMNSISHEHVIKNNKILHSFILFYVAAKSLEEVSLVNLKKNKKEIIESDYNLIQEDLRKKVNLKVIESTQNS